MKALFATPLGWRVMAPMLRPGGITVLMYHSVDNGETVFDSVHVDRFRKQMEWLKANCAVIDPNDFEDALESKPKQRPMVVLTFDDGYRDYHDMAYPILRGLGLPALVFLTTGFIDGGGIIWTETISWAVRSTRLTSATLPWDPTERFALDPPAARREFERRCKYYLKGIPDDASTHWRQVLMDELKVEPGALAAQRRMLSWDEVRAAKALTRYGGHTHNHPILSQTTPQRASHEIALCRDRIADETGIAPTHFAYPNGRVQDFNETTKDLLRQHGFKLGYSSIGGVHRPGMDKFAIRRQPTGAARLGDFAWLVAGGTDHD